MSSINKQAEFINDCVVYKYTVVLIVGGACTRSVFFSILFYYLQRSYRVAQNNWEHGLLRLRDCRLSAFKLFMYTVNDVTALSSLATTSWLIQTLCPRNCGWVKAPCYISALCNRVSHNIHTHRMLHSTSDMIYAMGQCSACLQSI